MELNTPAIVCSARPHGETGVIARLLTEHHGLIAAYVAGGRGRRMRPLLIPGNGVAAQFLARSPQQLPHARIEPLVSRAAWMREPLPAAAIGWACALTAVCLPERHGYPALYGALDALLDAVCHAPSARGWLPALLAYETLLLRELGYGGGDSANGGADLPDNADLPALLARFDALGRALARYPLADRHTDVMGARERLRGALARMGGGA